MPGGGRGETRDQDEITRATDGGPAESRLQAPGQQYRPGASSKPTSPTRARQEAVAAQEW